MITATGTQPIRLGRPVEPDPKNGAASFMLSYQGQDAINDRTAETSRIFLGIQIQCAQCHDHPFDGWRQEQFHELASYFARLAERPVFEMVNEKRRITGIQLVSRPFGEHKMPDRDNPRGGKTMQPKFLDGRSLSFRTNDMQRRESLADAIAKNNYYFAAAFVNRMWGEMMGQAFCQPIDDMGPGKTTVMPDVLARVSASFKGGGFDVRALLRSICNSDMYQRQIRPGESPGEHLQFAAACPTRLNAETLWQSLVTVLGSMGPAMPRGYNPFAARFSLEGQFKSEFQFDPSTPPDDVESSMPQALMLMNNRQIQAKIRAQGANLLGRILSYYSKDEDAVQILYLRTLAQTDRSRARKSPGICEKGWPPVRGIRGFAVGAAEFHRVPDQALSLTRGYQHVRTYSDASANESRRRRQPEKFSSHRWRGRGDSRGPGLEGSRHPACGGIAKKRHVVHPAVHERRSEPI